MMQAQLERCQEILAYQFSDPDLLKTALTHSSVAPSRLESNERLEFLGDVVLGLVICEALYRGHPAFLEGELTKIKSAVVSRQVCGRVARKIGLDGCLHVGKGFGPRRSLPSSLAAAVLESVVGAMYLDGGLEPPRRFILEHMADQIDQVIANEHARNYKSILQQHLQQTWNTTPAYELLDEKGPDHDKAFEVCVVCNGQRFTSAWANNKKEAEQLAAKQALVELEVLEPEDTEA
ncbi:MAG: ribonuclease III [Planctomycetota bacterium]